MGKNGKIDKYPIPEKCIYCGSDIVLTSNAEIYNGVEYGNGKCYLCRNCGASVGVHYDLVTPLGILATREMKELKKRCHSLFDRSWKDGQKKRSEAYKDFAIRLGIPENECHFGWFDLDMLNKAEKILMDMYKVEEVCGEGIVKGDLSNIEAMMR